MGRPAKAVTISNKNFTKEESEGRKEEEEKLKKRGRLTAPKYLSEPQKKLFKFIVDNLKEADILGKLDIPIIAQTAICIDRLQTIEEKINEDTRLLMDQKIMAAKDKYTKDFFRCCNELCLSPQARAKMALSAYKAKEEQSDQLSDMLAELSK